MEKTTIINTFFQTRLLVFKWRQSLSITRKIFMALFGALITGLCAQIKIPLPWTPVPLTGQTFAALLSGVMLGSVWGGISQIIYVALGVIGVPWFAGFGHGIAYLSGPTGGYLTGFILASFFLGYITDRYIRSRGFFSMLLLMSFANFILIYVPGLIWLSICLNLLSNKSFGFFRILTMGALPFIIGDVMKIVAAALAAKGITPKQAFHREVDREEAEKWRLP
jgi:biotin transport system substrate-specific component